jgi:hypothetical protein
MQFNDPRFTLVAGLTLAISVNLSLPVNAGSGKALRIAKAQSDLTPTPITSAPDLPSLSPTPKAPVAPASPGMSGPTPLQGTPNLSPLPRPSKPSLVINPPTTRGSKPALSPAPQPPLGMFYGEQEKLESLNGMTPRPLPKSPEPLGTNVPDESLHSTDEAPLAGPPDELRPFSTGTDRFGIAPPPGTLGQTYKRRSRPLEDLKHPRVAAIEVRLPENVDVTSHGLKPKWTGKLWRLESDPLLPGIPHIYEIKASWGEGKEPQVRTVRLIMGRIVDVDF